MLNLTYENRIVAFLDILGFKKIIHESESDHSKLEKIYTSLEFLKTWEKPKEWNLDLIEIEENAQKKGIKAFDIKMNSSCTCFSDSIVVSIKVEGKEINEAFSTLITNLSLIGVKLISEGILLRGGITIGNLIHHDNGIIMGQALIDAYELENKYSKYPRIILSDKLIEKLNYPLIRKSDRYPYHQYIDRFEDGCVGFHQMIYFQVLQSWRNLEESEIKKELKKIKQQIIAGLDSSFETPSVYYKYLWLKNQYINLIILTDGLKEKFRDLNEGIAGHNIHYSYTDNFYNKKKYT